MDTETKQYEIGAVEFRVPAERRWHHVMGPERVALLQTFYRREPLPDGIVPWVWGFGEVKHENVRWDTAGVRVTGPEYGNCRACGTKFELTESRKVPGHGTLGQQCKGSYEFPGGER